MYLNNNINNYLLDEIRLTVTLDVFKYDIKWNGDEDIWGLTVTLDVFKYVCTVGLDIPSMINSNIRCI